MSRSRGLFALLALLLTHSQAEAGPNRDVVRVIKQLGVQSGNSKVVDALKVLEEEGFLAKIGDALADGADMAAPAKVAAPVTAAAAAPGGITADEAKQIALAYAKPRLGAMGSAPEVTQVKEIAGSPRIFRVTIMPGTKLTLCFFMTYAVDVDATTGKVLRMK